MCAQKIEEKDREIEQAEMRLAALQAQDTLIADKVNKLKKFEDFLREVQTKYPDDFTDLQEITTRYNILAETNSNLTSRHQSSGGDMEQIMDKMERYKKKAGQKTLNYTNRIAEEQSALQQIEAQKAKLMIGNEEKTEQRLKTTSQHSIILMSIRSLYRKIAYKNS